jgi:urease accessory protein UreE
VVIAEGYAPFMLGNQHAQGYLGQGWMSVLHGSKITAMAVPMGKQNIVKVRKYPFKPAQRRVFPTVFVASVTKLGVVES